MAFYPPIATQFPQFGGQGSTRPTNFASASSPVTRQRRPRETRKQFGMGDVRNVQPSQSAMLQIDPATKQRLFASAAPAVDAPREFATNVPLELNGVK